MPIGTLISGEYEVTAVELLTAVGLDPAEVDLTKAAFQNTTNGNLYVGFSPKT